MEPMNLSMERKKDVSVALLFLLLVLTITTNFVEHWKDSKTISNASVIQKETKLSAKN